MTKPRKTHIYELRREGWEDYFELHVSPTLRSMRIHIAKTLKEDGKKKQENLEDTLALVSPRITWDGPFAQMFVNEEHLGVGILAHESLHVALAHERFVLRFSGNYGSGVSENEERLAYFLSDTIRGVINLLREQGHLEEIVTRKRKKEIPKGVPSRLDAAMDVHIQ